MRWGRILRGSAGPTAALAVWMAAVRAQTQLPEVTVTAPRPVVTRAPVRAPAAAPKETARAGPAARTTTRPTQPQRPPQTQPQPQPQQPTQPGTLPIVTDQFATVTVIPNAELRRNPSGTLGDVLFSKPGIT